MKAGLLSTIAITTLSVAFFAPMAAAEVIFVRATCDDGLNNGISWTDAHCGSQGLLDALDRAVPGDEVWVGQWIYKPDVPDGANESSFVTPSGVAVLGGFAGTESSSDDRDSEAFVTTLSGDLKSDDNRTHPILTLGTNDNAFHVVRIIDGDPSPLLDGFTVRAGFIQRVIVRGTTIGANILIDGGAPTVRNCIITEGFAQEGGGGVAILNAQATIESCELSRNGSREVGAGLASFDGTLV